MITLPNGSTVELKDAHAIHDVYFQNGELVFTIPDGGVVRISATSIAGSINGVTYEEI